MKDCSSLRNALAMKPARKHAFKSEWLTVAEIAARTGLGTTTVRRRIREGVPLEAPRMKGGVKPRTYLFRGEWMTAHEIAPLLGIGADAVRNRAIGDRIAEGDEMAHPREPQCNSTLVTIKGRTDTISGWARRNGINVNTAFNRIINLGWSPVEALTKPIGPSASAKAIRRRIITRMVAGFRTPAAPFPGTPKTGGQSETFMLSPGTGVGRQVLDLQSEKMNG